MKDIIIPEPLQIVMDDLGWFCGKDGREKMEPARTGITRRHCSLDYEIVNEIGRRLGMKINCAFVMGEWDSDNRLKNIPGLSPYGTNWDNASYFDKEEAKRCVEVINSSEFIDIAIHGLHHTYYVDGYDYNNSDYYHKKNDKWDYIPESEIRARLDACYDLMEYNGFKKNINSFVPPSFRYATDHLSKILKDYNIKYISTIFDMVFNRNDLSIVEIEDEIIVLDRNNNMIPWYEMETNLDRATVVRGIFGCHWANVCHKNPKENYKLADSWVNYFERCKKTFGIILSESIAFCATQSVYKKYSMISENNEEFVIDLNNIPRSSALGESFYISSKEPLSKWTGCDVELYEKNLDFINYKVTPKDKLITLG